MSKKFQLIAADPCWSFSDKLTMSDVPRGAAANYAVMKNEDIMALDVKSIADPDGCVLALWVPSSLLQAGLDTMKAWGFEHKQTYIWVKTKKEPLTEILEEIKREIATTANFSSFSDAVLSLLKNFKVASVLAFGMGRLFRQTHELCLIGTNNNKIYKKLENKSQRSVCFAENLKHSAKPEELQDSLDLMFPDTSLNRLEMFARRQRPGWMCIGNEAPQTYGEDIRDSIKKLL